MELQINLIDQPRHLGRRLAVGVLLAAALPSAVLGQPMPEEEVLLSAARQGNVLLFRSMLEQGASAHARDAGGANALLWAIDGMSEDMLREIMQLRLDVNAMGVRGLGALTLLVLQGRDEAFIKVLRAGARPGLRNADESTALHAAAQLGRERMAGLLLGAGAPLNAADVRGRTPLHNAAHAGHTAIVQKLIEQGADVNAADAQGITPLLDALFSQHEAIALYLATHPRLNKASLYQGATARTLAEQLNQPALAAALR